MLEMVSSSGESNRNRRVIDLAAIERLDRETCMDCWRAQFGSPPPKYTSLEFMRKALCYEAQVKAFGSHSKPVQKVFKASLKGVQIQQGNSTVSAIGSIADGLNQQLRSTKPIRRPTPITMPRPSVLSVRAGTHLVREWNGRTYQVEALDKGFRLDGKTYRSLSAIAKKITGAHWSGPRFFGLE